MVRPSEIIWPPSEVCYIHAMLFNTQSAIESIEVVSSVMEHLSEHPEEIEHSDIDTGVVLNHLQNIVVQGAAISRYFWPVRKPHEARGELLRQAFNIGDNNPLKNRDLRNEIEHFDERLDTYLVDGFVGYFFPEYFGPQPESDGVPAHIFRAYHTDVGVFCLLGKEYRIKPIADEIIRINDMLLDFDENGGRLFRRAT